MAFAADYMVLFDRLDDELRVAPQLDRSLFTKIIVGACKRIPVLSKSGQASRIDRLIEAGAWTDAAMAVIALELPDWQLRRLEYESGEWFCSLSRQPNVPATLDDTRRCQPRTDAGRHPARVFSSPPHDRGRATWATWRVAGAAGLGRHG